MTEQYRGAPMGAAPATSAPAGRANLLRVYLNKGGYDLLGNYWGRGQPLYLCGLPGGDTFHVRANSRDGAKAKCLAQFPKLTFYR